MASLSDFTFKKEHRLCKVGKEFGYFHCWEQYGDVIFPGLTVDSHSEYPGGQYSRVFGIVEFYDQIERVDPTKIQFVDETHERLLEHSKMITNKEENDGEAKNDQ